MTILLRYVIFTPDWLRFPQIDTPSSSSRRAKQMRRKRPLRFVSCCSAFLLLPSPPAGAQAIENELYLITPVSKDVHDPALKAICRLCQEEMEHRREDQRDSQRDPGGLRADPGVERAAPGRCLLGRRRNPFRQPGGRRAPGDHKSPQKMWDEIPATIGKPVGLPLKDPKKFWVGTTLEPYGLIYQPKLSKRLGGGDQRLG